MSCVDMYRGWVFLRCEAGEGTRVACQAACISRVYLNKKTEYKKEQGEKGKKEDV